VRPPADIRTLVLRREARLRELVEGFDVPGAVRGLSRRGERVLAGAGLRGGRWGAARPAPRHRQ